MKLKKLELFGFKSFYDKTTFDFSDGITAIVGPNGCGKSNIVDAIRWVLGEHAPSYLRSKALEDVIFAGSDAAGPLGMAEVSLTFSNEDGAAPPGYESYAEIQVTRRTFRDGDSEFLINRVPCRLKDIAELFLDTGAGARGYAIIEQGKIMTVVNARPDEKRMIIEEAAGVAKFRVRKREAERKMETTRQNLARVKDILEEVRRQLAGLERQVRKAERYKALREELRDLEVRIAAATSAELAATKGRIDAELAELERALLSVRSALAALEAERESGMLRLAEAESAVAAARAGHAARKEEIARRQAEWEGMVREESHLRSLVEESAEEIRGLEEEAAELLRRIGEAEETGQALRARDAASRDRIASLAAEAEETRADYFGAHERSERATSDLMIRVSQHSNAVSGTESMQRMIEESGRTLARLCDRVAEAEAALAAAAADRREAEALEALAGETLAEADRGREDALKALGEGEAVLESAAAARRRTEGLLAASASRLSALARVHEKRDWASSGVRAVLHNYSGKGNGSGEERPGIFGVIGELIETEATYERAVEAVLGERIQSIVVRDQADALSALQYLKESREGRGAFVPVTLRARDEVVPYTGEEGVIAPLTEVVRVPEECGDLARGLLGGTLLVQDLGCALRLWNRNGIWNSYVTLDGDMVTADGILVGGAQDQGDSGVLAVKREIRELEGDIASLSAEAARLAEEENRARREKAALEERLAAASARREEKAAALAEAQRVRAVVEMACAQAAKALEALVHERAYVEQEAARLSADLGTSEAAARESGHAREEEEDRVRVLAAEVERKRAAMEDARARLHAAEIERAGTEEKLRSAQALLAGLRESRESRLAVVLERGRRNAAYEEKIGALGSAAAQAREVIESAGVDLARLQEEVERSLGEAAEVQSRLAGIEVSLKEARRRDAEGAARLSDLRLSAQRVEMETEALDARMYQKYEVRLADLPALLAGQGETADLAEREARAEEIRGRMAAIGEVNLASLEEHRELAERHGFLLAQKEDLEKSLDDLGRAIHRISRTTRERFSEAFERINEKLQEVFPKLFTGGRAYLKLLDEDNLLESGVEIVAQPPGKKMVSLSALSGGEKALTAISLIFSIFLVKPSPFCFLDEVDAPLDDANIDRFNSIVREMTSRYQFLLITHNKRTMELADVLYGITMEKPGISKVVSVNFQA